MESPFFMENIMRITIDKLSLYKWCKINGRHYHNTRKRILSALKLNVVYKHKKPKKPKKTYEEIRTQMKINSRLRYGYSKEEALLNRDEFNKLRAQRSGIHKIGKYNLRYVCEQLGINYNTVYTICIIRKRMTTREYLESKGYDLTQFEE